MVVAFTGPNLHNQALTNHRTYLVVGLSNRSYRILNDRGEPILYPKEWFTVVDPAVPSDWVRDDFREGEYHVDPAPCSVPGFYEDYFDGDPKALAVFRKVVASLQRQRGS